MIHILQSIGAIGVANRFNASQIANISSAITRWLPHWSKAVVKVEETMKGATTVECDKLYGLLKGLVDANMLYRNTANRFLDTLDEMNDSVK